MTFRLLLADDSPTFRATLRAWVAEATDMRVVAEAHDGLEAVVLATTLRPDAIVMDVEMPRMNGLEATRRIMERQPTPVIVLSSLGRRSVELSLEAMRAGALMALAKPPGPEDPAHEPEWRHVLRTIRALADVRVVRRHAAREPLPTEPEPEQFTAEVVAIATSTGGPAAVRQILGELPADYPLPILLVQHIGHDFVDGLARWLNGAVPLEVHLARAGEKLRGGRVYLAPAHAHLTVERDRRVALSPDPPIAGFRPSATATFSSVAGVFGASGLGVILTGMGRDGVDGLRELRRHGGRIVAQDERTSVVHSMPGAAVREGLADHVLPLGAIPDYLRACAR